MAHAEELLAALLATWGNARLRRGADVPWAELEGRVHADLTGASDLPSQVRFPDAQGRRVGTAPDWLADLARSRASRVGLLPLAGVEPPRPPPSVGGAPVEVHMLHAFAGTGGVVLVARVGRVTRRWRTRIWMPPRTTLVAKDVLAFVASRASADGLREALLWQDEHNLHVTDGKDWARFGAALRPEHDEALVRAMGMVASNVRFQGDIGAWVELSRTHANPAAAWQYDLVRLPDGSDDLPAADVAGRARRLRSALVAIEAFAARIEEPDWAAQFRRAIGVLDGAELPEPVRSDFVAGGMGDAAARLLGASLAADVFGGMGSWNDLSPVDGKGYRAVSAALFEELVPSLVAATNGSDS